MSLILPHYAKEKDLESKEEIIAAIARNENLEKVNAKSAIVHPKKTIYTMYIKRILDLAIAVPSFILTLPINILIAIGTLITVGTPIIFKQKRIGKDGKIFTLYKFRSMTNDKDITGSLLPPSERVTRFGRFIRKTSLDELLNLYSIIHGDMSIIGPRPLPISFDERYSNRHKMRTAVKPGLECPTLDSNNSVRLYQEQFENDIWYVENISFSIDFKMVIALFKMVFNYRERIDHARVGGGNLVGYDENGIAFSMGRIPEKYEKMYESILNGVD